MKRHRSPSPFARRPGAPAPLTATIHRRVSFGDVDAMAIAWHGRYAAYCEEASTELRRHCGLGYEDFRQANLRAPVVQFHLDYHQPLVLDELIAVRAALVWNDAARLDIEYEIRKPAGAVAATGYTVQLFVEGSSGEVCFASPPLLERCRRRWQQGEFAHLQ